MRKKSKINQVSFFILFSYVAGGASILGLLLSNFIPNEKESIRSLVYTIFLVALVLIVLIHSYLKDKRKLHRYSEAVFFTHHVNHLVKEYINRIHKKKKDDFEEILQEIVDSIAQCFSILTGKRCRCCIKEIGEKAEHRIKTCRRDAISSKRSYTQKDPEMNFIENNTDFRKLWYAEDNCERYYINNNLIQEWKWNRYQNSTFQTKGYPKPKQILGLNYSIDWPLDYKSTLVLPIRFLFDFSPPEYKTDEGKTRTSFENNDNWDFWGFLCIDSNSRDVFDDQYAPDLGLTFADVLQIFFTQAENYLKPAS